MSCRSPSFQSNVAIVRTKRENGLMIPPTADDDVETGQRSERPAVRILRRALLAVYAGAVAAAVVCALIAASNMGALSGELPHSPTPHEVSTWHAGVAAYRFGLAALAAAVASGVAWSVLRRDGRLLSAVALIGVAAIPAVAVFTVTWFVVLPPLPV